MAKGEQLPATDRVARACGRGVDGGVVLPAAFELRSGLEEELLQISIDWVECQYDIPERQNIEGSLLRLKARRLRPQPVAILPVSDVRRIRRNGQPLDAVEDGHGDGVGQCHSAIIGYTGEPLDLDFQDALAELANAHAVVELT